jgi:glycosyltransferase involved in cell wall biosynthesis
MISVVIPVWNGAKFLAAALNSVVHQTFPADEVIVVDDGSTDESANIAASFNPPIRVLHRNHRGGASALNAGVAAARGTLLAFLDADDLWDRNKLAKQTAALASDPSLEAVFGRVAQFTDMDGRIAQPEQVADKSKAFVGVHKSAMLVRRSAFDRVGPFNTEVLADFPDWYARAHSRGIRTAHLESIVAFRRIHSDNTARLQRKTLEADYLKIIRALIAEGRIRSR